MSQHEPIPVPPEVVEAVRHLREHPDHAVTLTEAELEYMDREGDFPPSV